MKKTMFWVLAAMAAAFANAASVVPRAAPAKLPGIGVTPAQLAKMKRRLAVMNATTNRPVSAAIQVRDAKATFREKFAAALAALDAADIRAEVAEKRAAAAEARAVRLDALRTWLEAQRDAAVLPTTKAIYQAIIDRIDGE